MIMIIIMMIIIINISNNNKSNNDNNNNDNNNDNNNSDDNDNIFTYISFHFLYVYFTCRWVSSLTPARVTRWGGMISTPDAVLQAVIKRSLLDSGCPSHIVNELMENAHERRWPPGLSTLETRQLNRRQYENYVTKRIPGMLCEVT